jgi:tetratricopeptide (TPR) repeat protein
MPVNRESTIRFFETRHEREPRGRFYVALGELYRQAGRCTEALTLLEAGLAQTPGAVSPRVVRARCLDDLGRVAEAQAAWRAVLEVDVDHAEARRVLASAPAEAPAASRTAPTPPEVPTAAAEPVVAETPAAIAELGADEPAVVASEPVVAEIPVVAEETAAVHGLQPASPSEPAAGTSTRIPPAPSSVAKGEAASPRLNVPPLFQTRTLADIYLVQGHRQKAISILGRILEAHPERTDIAEEIEALRQGEGSVPPVPATAAQQAPSEEVQRRNREHFDAWVERTTGRNPH